MQASKPDIIFLIIITVIIFLLTILIVTLIYIYQRKRFYFQQEVNAIRANHEKSILAAQLEVQEETFQHISQEIHDNISLGLTLAKLNLNTFDWNNKDKATQQIGSSIEMVSRAISDLSDISKSLNSDIIKSQGLIKAIENEILKIQLTDVFTIYYNITGEPVYMDTQRELIIFRIIQEAFNNIIKHAGAKYATLVLHYSTDQLYISISDNGKGFEKTDILTLQKESKAGLRNMQARVEMIKGIMEIKSIVRLGTSLTFIIPIQN